MAQRDYYEMVAGAVLVGVLTLIVDFVIALASRLTLSRGLVR